MEEHVHLLFRLHPDVALAAFVRDLKISAGTWLSLHKKEFPNFSGWAKSYAAFSYSHSEQDRVLRYIASQREHHAAKSFAEEYREFLTENEMPIDEKYFLKE